MCEIKFFYAERIFVSYTLTTAEVTRQAYLRARFAAIEMREVRHNASKPWLCGDLQTD